MGFRRSRNGKLVSFETRGTSPSSLRKFQLQLHSPSIRKERAISSPYKPWFMGKLCSSTVHYRRCRSSHTTSFSHWVFVASQAPHIHGRAMLSILSILFCCSVLVPSTQTLSTLCDEVNARSHPRGHPPAQSYPLAPTKHFLVLLHAH